MAMLLTNEVMHKAKACSKDFLLLKVDTIKAFDCLGWIFLYRVLEKMGFGPYLINMLKALHKMATSSIVIQGRFT